MGLSSQTKPSYQLPTALQPGELIAIISPASPSLPQDLDKGIAYVESVGLTPYVMPHVLERQHYVAGHWQNRLEDFHAAFSNPDIKGILCARGGYGCMHLLPHINWELIAKNPKPFIGFSDVTTLLVNMLERAQLVCFHGPMLTSNLIENDAYTQKELWTMLMPTAQSEIPVFPYTIPNQQSYQCLHTAGQTVIEAPLMGGNMSLLSALCGTPYQVNGRGKLLFLEDWHEAYYSLDRKMTQLKYAGFFDGAVGLLLGEMAEMIPENWGAYQLASLLTDLTQDLGIPVGYGYSIGHGLSTATLPVGAMARLTLADGRLEILTSPVCPT